MHAMFRMYFARLNAVSRSLDRGAASTRAPSRETDAGESGQPTVVLESTGRLEDRLSQVSARVAAEPLDRTAHRDRRDRVSDRVEDGRADAGDAGFALGYGFGPPSAAHGRELGRPATAAAWRLGRRSRRPGAQDRPARTRRERQASPDRHRVAQTCRALGRRDTDAMVAVTYVQLRALPGCVAQAGEHTGRGLDDTPGSRGASSPGREPKTEAKASVSVTAHEAVGTECHCDAMGSRPGHAGHRDELREGQWPSHRQRVEHRNRLVDDAHPRYDVHILHPSVLLFGLSRERAVRRDMVDMVVMLEERAVRPQPELDLTRAEHS